MTLRTYLALMAVGTALSWGAVALIVVALDPAQTPTIVVVMLYASALLALTGTFSIAGLALRRTILRGEFLVSRQVAVSFRQAILLALLVVIALAFRSRSLLTWWNAALLAAAALLLEFFLAPQKPRQP